MRFTIEQRVRSLERDVTVLQDKIDLLHKMLRELRGLIYEYITTKVRNPAIEDAGRKGTLHPADAVYTFVCKRRFGKLEKDLRSVLKRLDGYQQGKKAG